MGDPAGGYPLALLVDDHGVVMVVGPVDAGVPHGEPPPLLTPLQRCLPRCAPALYCGARSTTLYQDWHPGWESRQDDLQETVAPLGAKSLTSTPCIQQAVHLPSLSLTYKGANLAGAHLEGANLGGANLEGANLNRAWLEGTDFPLAQLEGANLREAHLAGAFLFDAHLEEAHLNKAHLEGANLAQAHLEGANLSGAELDGKTILAGAIIFEAEDQSPLLVRLLRRSRHCPG